MLANNLSKQISLCYSLNSLASLQQLFQLELPCTLNGCICSMNGK